MHIELHADREFFSAELRDHLESSVKWAFRRFTRRIRTVRAYLSDANGPRGGNDKAVRLIVELVPKGELLVREVNASEFTAVSGAVYRARQALRKELRRKWERNRNRRSRQRANVAAVPRVDAAAIVSV
jgi:hypothetical protein